MIEGCGQNQSRIRSPSPSSVTNFATRCSRLAICALGSCCLLVVLNGCANLRPVVNESAEQKAALERWHSCLQRFDESTVKPPQLINALQKYCDGHRQDVVLTYPARLENEINDALSNHSKRHALKLIKASTQRKPDRLGQSKKAILQP